MALNEGKLAWLRWRDVWFMARVSAVSGDESNRKLRLHVLGESEAADKWLPNNSALLRPIKELPVPDLRVGALPARGACVQLLVSDATLWSLLSNGEDEEAAGLALVGKVFDVIPQQDASVVDIEGPRERRRVHIGNGYLRVISEDEVEAIQQRIAARTRPKEDSADDNAEAES